MVKHISICGSSAGVRPDKEVRARGVFVQVHDTIYESLCFGKSWFKLLQFAGPACPARAPYHAVTPQTTSIRGAKTTSIRGARPNEEVGARGVFVQVRGARGAHLAFRFVVWGLGLGFGVRGLGFEVKH